MRNKLLMFSGGPDSTAAAYLLRESTDLSLLTLRDATGAKNVGETFAAETIAQMLNLPQKTIDIASLNSLLDDLPNTLLGLGGGNRPGKSVESLASKTTCVAPGAVEAPLGLQLLHLCAAIYGISHGFNSMVWAVHKDDDTGHEGWIAEYVTRFNSLMLFTGYTFQIETPFLSVRKADLFKQAAAKGAPLELSFSCLTRGADVHCGKCQGCKEREHAFLLAGISTTTANRRFSKKRA